MVRAGIGAFGRDQRGYTLTEVLTVIAIICILIAIIVIVILGILERRRVDAAANQLAADLRLAHANATNQLTDWRVVLSPGTPDYMLVRLQVPHGDGATAPPTVVETVERSLPDGTKVLSTTTTSGAGSDRPFVEFNSDGTTYAVSGPGGNVTVSSTDEDPRRRVIFRSATSRVRIE